MKTRILENTIWRYSWEMKVMIATMLLGLIFIFASTAFAQVVRPFGAPETGLVNPVIVRPIGVPIAPSLVNPFSPIIRPFPVVNPFINQILLRRLLLRQLLLNQLVLNPFIDDDDLGVGLGLGLGAGIGIGERIGVGEDD